LILLVMLEVPMVLMVLVLLVMLMLQMTLMVLAVGCCTADVVAVLVMCCKNTLECDKQTRTRCRPRHLCIL
jgi:hypothetical protein